MDFLKLLEEYENYRHGFGVETSPSGHSACVGFAAWLNQNASQQKRALDGALVVRDSAGVVTCSVCGTGLGVE